jgi:hypothetical protein
MSTVSTKTAIDGLITGIGLFKQLVLEGPSHSQQQQIGTFAMHTASGCCLVMMMVHRDYGLLVATLSLFIAASRRRAACTCKANTHTRGQLEVIDMPMP